MTARHRGGGGWFSLPALILPVVCGFGLLVHYQAAGSGQVFSVWLERTYGLRHGPAVSHIVDGWTSALLGAAGPNSAVAAIPESRSTGSVKPATPEPAAVQRAAMDPAQEIRRLLAGRPESGLATVRDDLVEDLLAGTERYPDETGVPRKPADPAASEAAPKTAALLFPPPENESTMAAGDPARPELAPVSLAPVEKRVFVHYSTRDPRGASNARNVARFLRGQGYTIADVRAVAYPVKSSSVRYFFTEDAEAAKGLRTAVAAGLVASGFDRTGVDLKDFRHFKRLPRHGTIEVWVPLSGG